MFVPSPTIPNRYLISAAPDDSDPNLFPYLPGQTFFRAKKPEWATEVQRASSGRERRLRLWTYPIWTFKVAYEVIRDRPTKPEIQRMMSFFNDKAGRFSEWKFYDPTDNTVTQQPFGVGNGISDTFQLIRGFYYGNKQWTEPVRALLGRPRVYLNGDETFDFVVNPYGSITMNSAPQNGDVLSWSGQFYFVCRFDQDGMSVEQIVRSLWSMEEGLTFVSIKP